MYHLVWSPSIIFRSGRLLCGYKLRSCFCSPCQESLLRFSPYTDASSLADSYFWKNLHFESISLELSAKREKTWQCFCCADWISRAVDFKWRLNEWHTHQEYKHTNSLTFLRLLYWQGFNPITYHYMIDTSDISCVIHKGQGHFHLPLPVVCV